MYINFTRDRAKKKGELGKITNSVSLYQPKDLEVINITKYVQSDYDQGTLIQSRAYTEFNNRSLLQEINRNQEAFNSYVPPRSEDPDESWRAQTVRPITRNKLISIAAHVTEPVLYPSVFAQNASDEEDKESAQVMKDLVEYVIDNSNYVKSFVMAIISALVDPAVILNVEFAEVYRTVKEMAENGTYTKKEILDTVLSGFKFNLIPCKEILIANIYEPEIQRQRFIIRNKYVDYKEAELVYGKKPNWKYVKPGVEMAFDEYTNTFYDVENPDLNGTLVHEVTYYNRSKDLEVTFLSGVLMDEPERPNPRKDKLYPFAKSGYEPIGNGKFFYYKSAANKLGSDQEIVDTLYNMILDGTFLSIMPPQALYGSEDINSSVMVPGTVTSFTDPNTKLESIGPRSDIRAGLEAIGKVEQSMSESSVDVSSSGVGGDTTRTAREVLLLERNARQALGLFGKSIRFLLEDTGDLLISDILQHMTVGEMEETTDVMKFRTFILPEKVVDGKKVSKNIRFVDPSEIPEKVDYKEKSFELLDKEGGMDSDRRICEVNPDIFRTNKFKTKVSIDDLNPPSKALDRALNMELLDRSISLANTGIIDIEAVTRDFLFEPAKPGESDKYIVKNKPAPQPPVLDKNGNPEIKETGSSNGFLSNMTGSSSLGMAASSE